jgi:hypothetical protein
MFAFAQELQSLNQKDKELQRGGPGVTAVPARKGGWWVAVTAARVRTSYHKKLLVLQSSRIQRRQLYNWRRYWSHRERRYIRLSKGAHDREWGHNWHRGLSDGPSTTARRRHTTGRLVLEEAGPAHESRHGVVDHIRGYARGPRSVG